MNIYLSFTAVALASALATKLTKDYATRTQLLDIPTERSSHVRPVPRGGGAGFTAVTLLVSLLLFASGDFTSYTTLALLVGGASVAAIGWLDDRRSRPAALRFAVHCAAAIWVIGITPGLRPDYAYCAAVFFFLAITWLINSYNFMDGIDALAAGEAVAVGLFAAVLCESEAAPLCLVTAAAALGFLPWNWPRAKIFMGDVGSGFLGFVFALAWLLEARANPDGFFTLPILLGCFVADATTTLFWRMAKGEKWYAAHKLHAYQTYARVLGHRSVTLLCVGITAVWLAPCAWLAGNPGTVYLFLTGNEYTVPGFPLLFAALAYAPLLAFVAQTHRTKTFFEKRGASAPLFSKRKRTIAFVFPSSTVFPHHHLHLAAEAAKSATVHVFLQNDHPGPDGTAACESALRARGIEPHWITLSRRSANPLRVLREALALRAQIDSVAPDLVNAINLKAVLAAALATRGRPGAFVATLPGLGYLFADAAGLKGLKATILKKCTLAGLRLSLRGRRVKILVSNTTDAEELAAARPVPPADIMIIPVPGVDCEEYPFSEEPSERGMVSPDFRILLASRMLRDKGIAEFVAAARMLRDKYPEMEFLLAGEPDPGNPESIPQAQLETWSREGAVTWIGRCDDMPELLQSVHVVCLPTRYREGFPRILVEAMACGRAVVTTNAPGCRDLLAAAPEAALGIPMPADRNDPVFAAALLANALERLYKNPEERKAMARAGRAYVEKNLSSAIITEKVLHCFAEL